MGGELINDLDGVFPERLDDVEELDVEGIG